MPEEHPAVRSVASAIADEQSIDWDGLAHLRSSDRLLVEQLKVVAGIGHARMRSDMPAHTARRAVTFAYAGVVAAAGAKAFVGAIATFIDAAPGSVGWMLTLDVLFCASGLALIVGGTRDRRVQLLGALFVIMASSFADPLSVTAAGRFGAVATAFRAAPPEAFFALALWLFVWSFPAEPQRSAERRLAAVFIVASGLLGAVLCVSNIALALNSSTGSATLAWVRRLDRQSPTGAFWPLLLGVAIAAIPYLIWKSQYEVVDHKRRVSWFVAALAIGITPMLATVIVSPFVRGLNSPSTRDIVGTVLYVALAAIIPVTVYAVAVQRVMDVQLVLHRTMQHALARYAVWSLSLGPLAFIVVRAYLSRPGAAVIPTGAEITLAPLVFLITGFVVLLFRQQLLMAVDRWFLRGPVDSAEAISRLDQGFRSAQSLLEIAGILTQEVDRVVHPERIAIFLANHELSAFSCVSRGFPDLAATSALADLLRSARTEIQFETAMDGPVTRLLPERDKRWLVETGFQLFSPLVASNGLLLGFVALSGNRNHLPYTKADHGVIAALSSLAAMRLENRHLQILSGTDKADQAQAPALGWDDEPCVLCPACSRVWPTTTTTCPCGHSTVPAAIPLVINGKFHVERLIGTGGMGVVFLAIDLALDRRVAIKTLPAATREHALRLQREARAMASILHPNLAMIFSFEMWRQTPLLVVEYLEGGTLADRLKTPAESIGSIVELGVVLADVLDRLHAGGILHRDIKPSNIGYTRDGIPKLLDFGLAALFDSSPEATSTHETRGDVVSASQSSAGADISKLTSTRHLVGTPLYLSPEAIAGASPRPSFDLWSLSLVLYEAVAGTLPLASMNAQEVLARMANPAVPDVRQFRPDCPSELAAFFGCALAAAPDRRPATAAELREMLQRVRFELGPHPTQS